MFNENLRELRKSKGFTQEELATKVNVVRQTVSKWEKGLSVPDADSLQKIAEVLEVDVSQLLGAKIETEESRNEIAEQLSRINEQLVIKNRRTKKIIKVICLILLIPAIFIVISIILARLFFGFDTASGSEPVEEIGYEEYEDIEYDEIIEE
ncbi:MAG: helix-turn-helix domain-containing protein [Lachnospiraceae bacterium]|nr:helix-turn-helix domain-containing protein [Lachnospiraceae bacterium]